MGAVAQVIWVIGASMVVLAGLIHLPRTAVAFGRVPFLLYVTHIYLVHALAVAAGVAQGYPASAMLTSTRLLPEGYGFGLLVIYLVWLGVVALLYPLCKRYASLKARSRAWWLSYL